MSVRGGTEKEYVLVVGLIRLLGTGAGRSGHRHNKSYVTYKPLSSPIRLHRTLGTRRWLIHLENLCHQYAFTAVVLFPVKEHPLLLLLLFERYEFWLVALMWPAGDDNAAESDLDLSQTSNSELKHPQDLINSYLTVPGQLLELWCTDEFIQAIMHSDVIIKRCKSGQRWQHWMGMGVMCCCTQGYVNTLFNILWFMTL